MNYLAIILFGISLQLHSQDKIDFDFYGVDPETNICVHEKSSSNVSANLKLSEFISSFDTILYFDGRSHLESWKGKSILVKVSNDEPDNLQTLLGDIYLTKLENSSDKLSTSVHVLNSRIYLPTIGKTGDDYKVSSDIFKNYPHKSSVITAEFIKLVKDISDSSIDISNDKGKRTFEVSGNSYHSGSLFFIVKNDSKLAKALKDIDKTEKKEKLTKLELYLKLAKEANNK